MANTITVGASFKISNADPIDRRLVLTKAEMLAMNDLKMPRSDIRKYFALCVDDNQFYVYDKDAEPNEETGKFKCIMKYLQKASEEEDGLMSSEDKEFINSIPETYATKEDLASAGANVWEDL